MCVGATPSPSDGLESLEVTLTESMLSPELPAGGDLAVSLTGELVVVLAVVSIPRKSLCHETHTHTRQLHTQTHDNNTHLKTTIKAFYTLND